MFEEGRFCFACGAGNPSGLRLSFTAGSGKAYAEFSIPEDFQGYRNIVHGGIVTAILDEAMIKAASSDGRQAITAEITVRFRTPLRTGESACVSAEVVRSYKGFIESVAAIKDQDSNTIAVAKAKLLLVKEGKRQLSGSRG